MSETPTVGRIVHFYNAALAPNANNGTGPGPYAAIVTQVFSGATYINLKVLPYGAPWDEGSVAQAADATKGGRHWAWPPRA